VRHRSTVRALLVIAVLELGAAAITALLVDRGWMADIPRVSNEQITEYFRKRNPIVGWGPPIDAKGRITPLAADAPPNACVSTYGDSFTGGPGRMFTDDYPRQLGLILGCPVANHGWGGFGSDQALMLFRAHAGIDRAPTVVLGHASENILRNVNQYRNLLYGGQELGFKPRFRLEGGTLQEVKIPIASPGDFYTLRQRPESILRDDFFLGRPRRRFPYALTLARWLLVDPVPRAALTRRPRHAPFYDADHPSGALELTTQILVAFHMETVATGRRPIVLLIPIGADLLHARRTGRFPDQPLADALHARGVRVVHAGPAFLKRLGDTDPCTLFRDCRSHFNARGYRMLAEVVAEDIARLKPGSTSVQLRPQRRSG